MVLPLHICKIEAGKSLKSYSLPWEGTHGVSHWARVLETGLRLAANTDINTEVVQLFSVLHDAKRINEAIDPDHGLRASQLDKG